MQHNSLTFNFFIWAANSRYPFQSFCFHVRHPELVSASAKRICTSITAALINYSFSLLLRNACAPSGSFAKSLDWTYF